MKEKDEIRLSTIATLANDSNPQDFKDFANGEQYKLSDTFRGDSATLKNLTFVSYKSKDLKITFSKQLWNEKVFYVEDSNSLLIKDIDEELKQELPLDYDEPSQHICSDSDNPQ